MKIGDLVRYRRGKQEWIGVVLKTFQTRIFKKDNVKLVEVAMKCGVYTYKDWKLEVINESR
tara:strand:- start:1146 stop:1328 length:183 start_codon:yes stop_codon:yes gene_type:complete